MRCEACGADSEEPERLELLDALSECAQNKADLKALITELAYALDGTFRGPVEDLIQRAREAAKCQP